MRYLVAIFFAIAGAALAMAFASDQIANWAALQFKYASSDDAENMNQAVFMAVNLAGLVAGWIVGWAVGWPFQSREHAK